MQVGAADAAIEHLHQDIIVAKGRDLCRPDLYRAGSDDVRSATVNQNSPSLTIKEVIPENNAH